MGVHSLAVGALLVPAAASAGPAVTPLPAPALVSVHRDQMIQAAQGGFGCRPGAPCRTPAPITRPEPRSATSGPDVIVYGYQAYWSDDLYAVAWDELSHIAIFQASVSSNGSLSGTSYWSDADLAVSLGAPYGVKVHLCVTNFDSSEISSILGSSANRSNLITQLRTWVDSTGAHGVNIDFEGLSASASGNMVTFTQELADEFGDEVVLATPAVDWSGAWDYSELSKYAYLFIMGYGYHWTGGDPGPNDPLQSSSFWGTYSLEWTLDDYSSYGATPGKVILGLPLYGQEWATGSSALGANALGDGWSVTFDEAYGYAATYGRSWDADSSTPWYYDGYAQGWYGDVDSVRDRVGYAVSEGIGGIGFWALHYEGDDPAFWAMIHEETTFAVDPGDTGDTDDPTDSEAPTDTGPADTGAPEDTDPTPSGPPTASDFAAEAGRPFLAYVGDTVILSGAGSDGPPGVALEYVWTQVAGPPVQLVGADTVNPSFKVEAPGTTSFELRVGAFGAVSEPDTSYVIVIDEDAGRRFASGCSSAPAPIAASGLVAAAAALLVRRRRGGA